MRWCILWLAACRLNFASVDGGASDDDSRGTPDTNLPSADGNIAFLTSTLLNLYQLAAAGGLSVADAECQARASAVGFPGTYVAWFSTSTTSASSRLGAARGWVRPDGAPFADTLADILAGRIYYPLSKSEVLGSAPIGAVATGTIEAGTHGVSCDDLSNSLGTVTVGSDSGTTAAWTNDYVEQCEFSWPVYCFGTSRQVPLVVAPTTGRVGFVSSTSWQPGGGLASADAACQSDADAAGLPGTYLALLATASASASSRFVDSGEPWVRVDGIPFCDSAMRDAWSAPLNVTTSGLYVRGAVFLGASNDANLAGQNCNDFNGTGGGQNAETQTAEKVFRGRGLVPCNTSARLHCLQQ